MAENKNEIHIGDGVADAVKSTINTESAVILTELIKTVSNYLKSKLKDIPETIENLLSSPEAKQEVAALWSEHLFREGLAPKGYDGLPDELLIHNFHQEGYITGLHVGYMLAMMALVDNGANENLILSVRDSMRPNLSGRIYDNCDEFISLYKDEKYRWIENRKKEEKQDKE